MTTLLYHTVRQQFKPLVASNNKPIDPAFPASVVYPGVAAMTHSYPIAWKHPIRGGVGLGHNLVHANRWRATHYTRPTQRRPDLIVIRITLHAATND